MNADAKASNGTVKGPKFVNRTVNRADRLTVRLTVRLTNDAYIAGDDYARSCVAVSASAIASSYDGQSGTPLTAR